MSQLLNTSLQSALPALILPSKYPEHCWTEQYLLSAIRMKPGCCLSALVSSFLVSAKFAMMLMMMDIVSPEHQNMFNADLSINRRNHDQGCRWQSFLIHFYFSELIFNTSMIYDPCLKKRKATTEAGNVRLICNLCWTLALRNLDGFH